MNLAEVKFLKQPLSLIEASTIDELESELWVKLPAGYREYMTALGTGVLSGFVRVYSPRQIRDGSPTWRRRIAHYWFWDESLDLLPK